MEYCKCIDVKHNTSANVPERIILGLGDFDGVHLAHKKLLTRAKEEANKLGLPSGIWCFSTPYYKVSANGKKHFLLSLPEERMDFLQNAGIDYMFIADFEDCRDLPAATFVEKVLLRECHCAGVVCGFNFAFGRDRTGTPKLLKRYFPEHAVVIDEVRGELGSISSSLIRQCLSEGKIKEANEMLGHTYSIRGTVIHGLENGRKFGFPTANVLFPDDKLIPAFGVYYTHCEINGQKYDAVTDIGTKPTVIANGEIVCESYLLAASGDFYGKEMRIEFAEYIRPEMKFSSIDALVDRIRQDVVFVMQLKGQK